MYKISDWTTVLIFLRNLPHSTADRLFSPGDISKKPPLVIVDKENLNEFKGGTLRKKCFIEAQETHPDILRGGHRLGTHTKWKRQ